MMRVFLDSSVIYSGCFSAKGYSRDLILVAVRGEYTLVCSQLVIEEVRRNLAQTSEEHLLFLDFVLESIPMEIVRPTKRQVLAASHYTALKDAPIAAAALRAKVDLLVSLDKKHILDRPELAEFVGAQIVTPQEAVAHLRKMN